jgi:hypothetical protein
MSFDIGATFQERGRRTGYIIRLMIARDGVKVADTDWVQQPLMKSLSLLNAWSWLGY